MDENKSRIESSDVPAPDPVMAPITMPDVPLRANAWQELGEVLWLSLPIIVTMASYTAMNFVDVLMVGRHSSAELAAVGPAASSFFIIASLMMGTISIINTFVAQSVGRGEKREAPGYVFQAMYLALFWGAVALLFIPLTPSFFAWAGHPAAVQQHEVSYFQWMILRIPALGMWMSMSAFYQATKRPVVPMWVALIGNVFNLGANYALIFGKWGLPELGIRGAAIATVVSTALQAAMLMCLFLGARTNAEYGTRSAWRVNSHKLWSVVRYGLPSGLNWSLENASWTLFLLKIIGGLGAAALAANNATMQILHLSFMPIVGLNTGVQAIVGHHIGLKDYDGAKRRAYRAMMLAVAFMVTMGLMFVIFRRDLIMMFVKDSDVPGVVDIGAKMLIFAAMFQAFDAIAIVSYGALKGAGDTLFPMASTLTLSWLFFLPVAYLLTIRLNYGVVGAWLSVTIYVAAVSGVNFWRFASNRWHKINLFNDKKP